ncbi:DHBP synthase RibB-like alpha/beta domain-containing protein [Lasiosphaeria hispida]|uniref:Threonylcarbamoyl-AMP synthase n=1 Tax=Lasiosphaeria hispida TaxID=260671 RepID=A0AAJ0H6T3_9PEZI|nr:DHBP synthase RibB-like alpha/beta domain-containing protein [Lasiosphaeria hispida]
MKTRILKVPLEDQQGDPTVLGRWAATSADGTPDLNIWELPASTSAETASLVAPLHEAAAQLRNSAIPVAFPTETVYGLGADATRSAAVRGIYAAKGRPSDNPLIVHICDLEMLRSLLLHGSTTPSSADDPIPAIYHPLIARFWPGPLTILLPLPVPSPLAPEVTAGLATFGVRMPASALARTLIKLAGAPLAAPSANASTRPSPTTAAHVLDDLAGRIELVVDGGACAVGVESTVVDGLCAPAAVLRPGGVSMEALRGVAGWEGVERAYRDAAEVGKEAPRAPGMKYKHYSPRARVVLFEAGAVAEGDVVAGKTVAVIRTGGWGVGVEGFGVEFDGGRRREEGVGLDVREGRLVGAEGTPVATFLDVDLGRDIKGVAHGLFAALRELDRLGADVIFVEGVNGEEDIAAAVMNRLRKAASEIRG